LQAKHLEGVTNATYAVLFIPEQHTINVQYSCCYHCTSIYLNIYTIHTLRLLFQTTSEFRVYKQYLPILLCRQHYKIINGGSLAAVTVTNGSYLIGILYTVTFEHEKPC